MTPRSLAAALAAALLLSGCSTLRDILPGTAPRAEARAAPGAELIGNSLRMQAANGEITDLRFRRDGAVRAEFRGRSLDGRWETGNRLLCFHWPSAPRECWPYRSAFERGRTRTLTSDRGNVVRVTLL